MFLAAGCGALRRGDLPPRDPRLLQGAALPRRRRGDPRACTTSRTPTRWAACARRCRATHAVFLVGVLAIAGFPPLLGLLLEGRDPALGLRSRTTCPGHRWLWAIGLVTAALTAFYMFRLHFRTFYGRRRAEPRGLRRTSTSRAPAVLRAALRARRALGLRRLPRACPQVYGDLLGVPDSNSLANFLRAGARPRRAPRLDAATELGLAGLAIAAALLGLALAVVLYLRRPGLPAPHRRGARGALPRCSRTSTTSTSSTTRVIVRPAGRALGQRCCTASSTRG